MHTSLIVASTDFFHKIHQGSWHPTDGLPQTYGAEGLCSEGLCLCSEGRPYGRSS